MKKALETIIAYAAQRTRAGKIVLFGSYANGCPDVYSDIDLLIITELTNKIDDLKKELISHAMELSLRADVFIHTSVEIEEAVSAPGSFLGNVMKSGKTVYNKPVEKGLTQNQRKYNLKMSK